jgi:hypothetical protein
VIGMGAARQLFIEVGWVRPGDEVAYQKLCSVAELWRGEGQPFSAGLAMLRAADAAWGNPDRMIDAYHLAIKDFEKTLEQEQPYAPASIAALCKLHRTLLRLLQLFEQADTTIKSRARELGSELAERLITHFGHSEHADNYLVRGVVFVGDLDGSWSLQFPDYEVSPNVEQLGHELVLNVPSALQLFVVDRDWLRANEIVSARPNAFTTPGLAGWRAVTLASVNPMEAVERFDEAADAFSADSLPDHDDLMRRGGHWSGINQQLWAKFFRARARIAEAVRSPARVKELLAQATDCFAGTESGWHSHDASRFHVLIKVLSNMVSDPASFSFDQARREYMFEMRISEETEEDRLALTFISDAEGAFRGFATDPLSELTRNRLGTALEALARIRSIGPGLTEAARPEIGKQVHGAMMGPVHTWMHRALESIRDEAQLRAALLRLLQSGRPRYAQIRHGPIEYGKDIAVLLDIDGSAVLRHYQVKCGDINMKKWRESKDELEEIFLVPMNSLQLPVTPDRIEAVLLTNGHANQHVEPVIDGWINTQWSDHQRKIEFMHIDAFVDWIAEHNLVNELRTALRERCIKIGEASQANDEIAARSNSEKLPR